MSSEYQPFFSRKQLTALIWFCVLAILVLSSLGPGDVEYRDIERSDDKQVYWMELDEQPLTLTLLLPTELALNPQQRQLQQLQSLILQQRLRSLASTTFSYSVNPKQDRMEVTLQWPLNAQPDDLRVIWDHLNQPVSADQWQAQIDKIQARHYLESQKSEQMLVDHFFTLLQPDSQRDLATQLPGAYQQLFSAPIYSLSGTDAEDYVEQIRDQLPQRQVAAPSITAAQSAQPLQTLDSNQQTYRLLTGSMIPPRNSEHFVEQRIAAQVLQDLLDANQEAYSYQFRILWAALADSGYQAVVLNSPKNPLPVMSQLQFQVDEDLVEESQERLAALWQERMRALPNQLQALNLIAFYQLPTETMASYAKEILDTDPEIIVPMVKQSLTPAQQISILQQPALL